MKHKLSTRVLSMLMAIIMMLSLTTSVFAADPPASAEPEVIVEEAAQNSPAPSASPAPGDDPSRLSTIYEGHRIHYIDSKKQPLPKNAELFMNEINEDDVPFYLQRAAHSLGLESCGMYLYFIADPLLEDASTAEIMKYQANPDDPEDRMTVEITLIDDSKMTDEEKELRLEELQNIHLEDLRVIQLGAYWDYDTILPHSEENGVIRFEIDKIAPFILFIPDWESAVQIPEEQEPAEVPEEIAAPIEDTGTQQVTEPVDQPAELAPVPEETVSEVPVESAADTQAADIQNPEPASDEEPVEEVNEQTVTASGTDYSVSLTYSSDANIPEGSMFELSELPASGILYDNLTTSVASTLNAETEEISSVTFVAVDVKKDGDSVPLDAPVSVSIVVDDPADGDTVTQVIALGQQNEVLNTEAGTGTYSSTTDSLSSTYAIVRITRQATLKTDDDQNYLITVTYDRDDPNIPIDVELVVKELKEGDPGYDEYMAASAAVTGTDRENLAFAKAFDICLIDPATGLECQPTKEVGVSIQLLEEEVSDSAPVDVIHFGEDESPKQLDAALNAENAIEFATPGFSVFVIMQVIKEQVLNASDGQSYKVTVTYDSDSGIPEDAELSVSELKEGDEGYTDYVAMAAEKLGTTQENLVFARPFDITLENPQTGERYQPNSSVKVSVRLMDEDLTTAEEVSVLHFAGDTADEPEVIDATINGETVEFETSGFSVYVLIGSNGEVVTPLYTFKFFVPSEDVEGGYTEYILRDKDGNLVTSQSVAHSSELIVPQMPSDETKVFAGWYEGTIDSTGHIILEESPYDFDNIDVKPETLIQDTKIDLYAVYTIYATVIFHDQYDSESGSFPVAYTRRAELKEEAGSVSAKVKISDLSVAYTSSGGAEMAFSGWSETPITTPGAPKDDEGHDVVPVVPDADGCITVTGIMHLYPIFREIHWLTYYAAQSGLSAAYVPPVRCYNGESVGSTLPTTFRPGYHFMGWYTGSLRIDGDVEIVTYSTQITNSDGTLVDSADDGGVYISGGQLYLRTDATLYAKWQATYNIIYWKQLTTETPETEEKHYEYAETISKSAEIGDTVTVTEGDRAVDRYDGYQLGHYDPPAVIGNTKDITVLNVYYDLSAAYTPSHVLHILTFDDSVTGAGGAVMPDPVEGLEYNTSLKDYIPPDPVSGRQSAAGKKIYTFSGWYMDQACTIKADLSSMSMPDADLTVYAGWEPIKFKVDIDPNYGALYAEENGAGTGATFFSNTYDDEPIGEYTHVTRDYVESSSGTWFYVKHDRAYGGDRHTYYTKHQNLATEDTTFEYAPGAYTYIGWYEVKNGVLASEPYDFTQHTDHDTTLRLLWKKNDVYYLAYDAKDGTLDDGGNKTVVLPDGYADFAKITLNQSALPPSGFTFAGWQVHGSESNVIYAPGQVFTLHADDAKRSGGKDIVFLDAVYVQVGTASIIYDANGGTIAESGVDFGKVPGTGPDPWVPVPNSNIDVETATVFGLTNNSRFKLSTGTGFIAPADSDAAFLGWSDKAVCDESATFYDKKYSEVESPVTYGISETNKLYAVWGVPVTYHLNSSKADWGAEWDPEVYTKDSVNNTYFQTVKRGNAISEPENVPIYTEQPEQVFRYWATRTGSGTDDDPYNYTPYVFSQPVTGALDLYAYWEDPNFVKVHAVDASDEELVEKTDDTNWTVTDVAVSATETDLIAPSNVTPPEGENYEFAFVAASKGLDSVSESNVVTAIKYENKKNWVKYAGESTFKELETDCELYFVFYQKKKLNIGYKSMDANGALTGVTTTDDAPKTTGNTLLGSYDMSNTLTAPLTYTEGFSYYAFAVGSVDTGSDMNASNLSLITDAAGQADPVPTLRIRNTWRGFEYTTGSGDDASWTNCGYDPQLYVIYYTQQPTVILFREETVGSSIIMDTKFTYNVTVTQTITNGSDTTTTTVFDTTPESAGAAYHKEPYTLMNGEEQSAILFYSAPEGGPITTQTITITQTLNDDFSTTVNSQSGTATQPNIWTYTSNAETHATQTVTFTNTHKSLPVEVHVAMVENDGIFQRDNDYRNTTETTYKFNLELGTGEIFLTKLPSADMFTGDAATYAFGAVLVGTGFEGSAVTVKNTDVASVSYEKIEDNIYELVLRDDGGNIIDELGSDQLYYLYYPMPQIRYVKEGANENLTDIKGFLDNGETSQYVTYSHALLEMNGNTVEQRQKFKVPLDGLTISQSGNSFRMPAVLDDGEFERYLSYAKLGVGTEDAASVSDLAVSPDLTMQLRIQNNTLQYSFDGTTWTALSLTETPTIYAIYTERGYDLQISKTIYMSESGENPIFSDKSFTVTISSMAITKNSYEADGAESETISATPTDLDIPGTITLSVVDGTKIRIKGLGQGDYTVVESENENYILTAKKGPIVGGTTEDVSVTDNTTISLTLDSETKLDLTNSPKAICRIGDVNFYTLKSMIEYVEEFIASKTAEAEMLTDYQMPAADTLTVPEGFDITLTTADSLGHVAEIKRTNELADVPLMTNNGTLTISNLTLEGNNVPAAAPMIQSAGNLTIGSGAAIQNAKNTGNGGAISATAGNITISGMIDKCSAAAGGAIYHSGNGTITINGTVLTSNTATSGDGGAIYLAGGTVYVTGSSTISSNKAESGRGGAIYVGNAVIEIDQAGAMTGNTAKKGGAIYAETAEITVSKTLEDYDPAITGNTASDDNGGAIYVGAGSVTVSGGSVSNNVASSGQGGAIYTDTASVTVSGAAVINTNSAKAGGAVCSASGAVTVSGGTIQNNEASDSDMGGGAIYAGSGNVTLSGGSLSGNNSTAGSGGAVYANSGNVEVTGGSLTGNTARTDGGAIYAVRGTVSLSVPEGGTAPTVSGNTATSGNGGAICTGAGAVSLTGMTLTGNHAGAAGGAVYARTGAVSSVNSIFGGDGENDGNTAGTSGGAIYADSGNVTVSGGSMAGNTATSGSGGAVYAGSGVVDVSGGTVFTGNNAASGNGGAMYADSGSVTLTAAAMSGNSAKNGAACFVNTGRATFSAGSYTGNTASAGGAIGVGNVTARLFFTGNVQVSGNSLSTATDVPKTSNVYLDQDDDAVINIDALGGSADIGIYVPDAIVDTRSVPGARFAVYMNDANVNRITNDRYSALTVQKDTEAKKLYWGNAIKVSVHKLDSYGSSFTQPASSGAGEQLGKYDAYYPEFSEAALSELGSELVVKNKLNIGTKVYAAAYLDGVRSFEDYITELHWDKDTSEWYVTTRAGETVFLKKTDGTGYHRIYIYYAEPAYLSIENNTDMALTISGMTVEGISVINSDTVAGYGMVFAKNGAIRAGLLPVTAEDLELEAGQSISLLIPGGQNKPYTLDGSFETTEGGSIRLRRGAESSLSEESVNLNPSGSFEQLTGSTLTTAGTYMIIFGDDKMICKVVDAEGTEHPYSRISAALAAIVATTGTNPPYTLATPKTATIEMLTDYLLPATDHVLIPRGFDITLTTASKMGGTYRYNGEGKRATISRDSENKYSMIDAWNSAWNSATGKETDNVNALDGTVLRVSNLILDGKSVRGESDGGAVASKYVQVYIDTVDFKNVYASNGGAMLIMFSAKDKNNKATVPGTILDVRNSDFTGCTSWTTETSNRLGGGAIVSNAETMTLENCDFTNCTAVDQAGAAFHRVDGNYNSWTTVTGCTFTNCSANAAGGLELDSKTINVTDSKFEHCVATQRNGGGFNVYALNTATPSADCWVTVSGCTFNDCQLTTTNTSNGNGGGFRCNAVYTKVENSTFTNNLALFGGGFCISNGNAKMGEVYGCTFERNTANQGAGIFGKPYVFIIGDYTDAEGEHTRHTEIKNCTAKNEGGGIYHDKNANNTSLTITNATISGNRTTNSGKNGGGVFTNCREVKINGASITDNTCTSQGGGLYAYSFTSLSISDSEISRNIASGNGGGVWFDADNDTNRAKQVLTIKGSSIDGNTSNGNGGGVYTLAKTVTIGASETKTDSAGKPIRSSVSNNTVQTNGGGIYQSRNVDGASLTISDTDVNGNTASAGGGIYALVRTLTMTTSEISRNKASGDGGGIWFDVNNDNDRKTMKLTVNGCTLETDISGSNGGGIYTLAKTLEIKAHTEGEGDAAVTTRTTISNCTAAKNGGGIYQNRDVDGSSLTISGTDVKNNKANGTGNSELGGGGVYANVRNMTLTDSTVIGNTAAKHGGGIYKNSAGNDRYLIIEDHSLVKDNTAGNQGGGIYDRSQLWLRNNVEISGNRLTTNTAANCAGVYLEDSRTLYVGPEDATDETVDTIKVHNNTTANGTLSDLRLWWDSKNKENKEEFSVYVYCSLSEDSEIRVVNAAKVGTWFGSSQFANPAGFSDDQNVFKADASTLYGIIDRNEESGKHIIWAGPPIAKITYVDEYGNDNILFLKPDGTYPAIFDRLGTGSNDQSPAAAFNMLCTTDTPALYKADGTLYEGNAYCIKMLDNFETPAYMYVQNVPGRTITFTTAGKDKDKEDGYPFKGSGTRATVTRSSSVDVTKSTLNAYGNLILENIVLDGGSQSGVPIGNSTRCMWVESGSNAVVSLGENALLQNGTSNGKGGGGVYIQSGTLNIQGGIIRNCTANNGGGIYENGGTLMLSAGNIFQCTATGNGGGVFQNCVNNQYTPFTMSGGTISGCTAQNGGGVLVANNINAPFTMSGGSIINNEANTTGGGIAIGGNGTRLNFSGKVTVSGNTATKGDSVVACNVELNQNSKAVINTNNGGLLPGGYIGVYVPGTRDDNNPGNDADPYKTRGGENDAFGTFAVGVDPNHNTNSDNLYCFVNDRNGLRGGIKKLNPDPKTIYWVKSFSIQVTKTIVSGGSTTVNDDEKFLFKVNIRGQDETGQIKAKDMNGQYGDMMFASNGIDTTTAVFALTNGNTITGVNFGDGLDYEIFEYLVVSTDQQKRYAAMPMHDYDYSKTENLTVDGTEYTVVRANVYTGKVGENINATDGTDPYASAVEFRNLMPVCKITDTNGDLLYQKYTWNNKEFYAPAVYTELTGDDGALKALEGDLYTSNGSNPSKYPVSNSNGVQIKMLISDYALHAPAEIKTDKVTLTTAANTDTLFPRQDSLTTPAVIKRAFENISTVEKDSMFIVTNNGDVNGDLTLASITLDGRKDSYLAYANGGIVQVQNGGRLTIMDGATLQNSMTATGYNGGAVYVAQGGSATVTGGSIIRNESVGNNESVGDGAGIYLAEGSTLNLSGNPNFGGDGLDVAENIKEKNNSEGNFKSGKSGDLTLKFNGGKRYKNARQDIFIAGYEGDDGVTNANSLNIIGDITSGAGTIWVWAEKLPHYKTLEQFARYTAGVEDPVSTLAVFRNAQPDDVTGESQVGEYLHGTTKSDDTGGNVFWHGIEGSAHVMLVKVLKSGASYQALSGKSFTVYTDSGMNSIANGTQLDDNGEEKTISLEGLSSGAGGAFFIGELAYGKYYVKETGVNGHFEFAVNENGVITIDDYDDKTEDPDPLKEVRLVG